jgi:hypothetical protein
VRIWDGREERAATLWQDFDELGRAGEAPDQPRRLSKVCNSGEDAVRRAETPASRFQDVSSDHLPQTRFSPVPQPSLVTNQGPRLRLRRPQPGELMRKCGYVGQVGSGSSPLIFRPDLQIHLADHFGLIGASPHQRAFP